jgi:hypothetical protein
VTFPQIYGAPPNFLIRVFLVVRMLTDMQLDQVQEAGASWCFLKAYLFELIILPSPLIAAALPLMLRVSGATAFPKLNAATLRGT